MQSGESIRRKRRSIWKRIVRFAPRWLRKRRWLKRSAVRLRWKDHNSPRRQWSDRLYEARHGVWPWVLATMLGLILASAGALLILTLSIGFEGFFEKLYRGQLSASPVLSNSGIWTFLLALLAAPLAWYLWLIRDRNRLAEFSNTRLKELREYFYKLQEWATDSDHPSRQVTALFQLRDFLRGDRVLIPRELANERRRFVRMAREFIVVLLRNRNLWESAGESDARSRESGDRAPGVVAGGMQATDAMETETESVRHPVQAALEAILREDGYRLRDLSGADLKGFNLPGADLRRVNLNGANLSRASLQQATLANSVVDYALFKCAAMTAVNLSCAAAFKADFSEAELCAANLNDSQFRQAKFHTSDMSLVSAGNSDFSGSDLGGAILTRALLTKAQLHSADLGYTIFTDSILTDAIIGVGWQNHITGYDGTPIWCDDETGEPLDPQPDAEPPPAAS